MKAHLIPIVICCVPVLAQANVPSEDVQSLCGLSSQIVRDVHAIEARRVEIIIGLLEAMDRSVDTLTGHQIAAMDKAKADFVALHEARERARLEDNLMALSTVCIEAVPLPDLP